MSVSVCVSLASDSSKLGAVTASDMRMNHVFIILTLTFIQGHTYLKRENNRGSIISETFQAMAIRFAVKIVRQKVYITFTSPMTLIFIEGHNSVSNVFLLAV